MKDTISSNSLSRSTKDACS